MEHVMDAPLAQAVAVAIVIVAGIVLWRQWRDEVLVRRDLDATADEIEAYLAAQRGVTR